jgi:hypothetical protein
MSQMNNYSEILYTNFKKIIKWNERTKIYLIM